jgi:isopentenyl diphosphate isomerase/L-lactate dehydrogenase-like FMN-dependent dehydrogenase
MLWAPRDLDNLITDPKEALDIFDFEPVAKRNLPPAHFGYMVTGIDDEVTCRANREGFLKYQLRPRRLVDVGTICKNSTQSAGRSRPHHGHSEPQEFGLCAKRIERVEYTLSSSFRCSRSMSR